MSYTLTYFDIPAVAEPIRLLLLLGKFEYEDRRVQFKEWPEMKSTTKWGQLPVLEIPEGQSLSQSRAILRYLGRQTIVAGYTEPLYPSDPLKAFYVDELMDTLDDARLKLIPTFSIKDQSEKEAARAALFGEEGDITKLMKKVEEYVGKEFCVSDTLTLADIYIFTQMNFLRCGFFDGIPGDFLGQYPKLSNIIALVQKIPGVNEYYTEMASKSPMYKPFQGDA